MTDKMRTIGPYDFPARDRQELFGDDQIVNVQRDGQMFMHIPGCFRVPKAMKWADFHAQIEEWAGGDPDYKPGSATDWRLDDEAFDPKPDQTIADLGIAHKGLVRFRTS